MNTVTRVQILDKAIYTELIPLGKVCIQQFYCELWVNNREDWVLCRSYANLSWIRKLHWRIYFVSHPALVEGLLNTHTHTHTLIYMGWGYYPHKCRYIFMETHTHLFILADAIVNVNVGTILQACNFLYRKLQTYTPKAPYFMAYKMDGL